MQKPILIAEFGARIIAGRQDPSGNAKRLFRKESHNVRVYRKHKQRCYSVKGNMRSCLHTKQLQVQPSFITQRPGNLVYLSVELVTICKF